MKTVTALGGNALLLRGEPATQRTHVLEVASAVAALAAQEELVLTHGKRARSSVVLQQTLRLSADG